MESSSSLSEVNTPIGSQMTLNRQSKVEYKTSSGYVTYEKIISGFKPVLFPTAVSRNACFEYRFSIKNMILPKELPKVTDLYFKDIVVKIQDIFTEVAAHGAIQNGIVMSYMPFSAVMAQDSNGIETEEHEIYEGKDSDGNEMYVKYKFINSERIIKRDSSPMFVVSSNLKFSKSLNVGVETNDYKALAIYNVYDQYGKFIEKVVKSVVSVTPEELEEVINSRFSDVDYRKGKKVCIDVILCDVLIFCLKSFDFRTAYIGLLSGEDVDNMVENRSVPIGWMTPEEKLKRFNEIGTYTEKYNDYDKPIPNSLFQFVDMQERCEKIFRIGRPSDTVFMDKTGVVAPFIGQYVVANEMISARILSDN